jgi:hypothetical protein
MGSIGSTLARTSGEGGSFYLRCLFQKPVSVELEESGNPGLQLALL